jgi:hypothetical protein
MSDRNDTQQARRETESVKTKQKEGFGAVPNVTAGQATEEAEQLKQAVHDLEEQKGDWGKDR